MDQLCSVLLRCSIAALLLLRVLRWISRAFLWKQMLVLLLRCCSIIAFVLLDERISGTGNRGLVVFVALNVDGKKMYYMKYTCTMGGTFFGSCIIYLVPCIPCTTPPFRPTAVVLPGTCYAEFKTHSCVARLYQNNNYSDIKYYLTLPGITLLGLGYSANCS